MNTTPTSASSRSFQVWVTGAGIYGGFDTEKIAEDVAFHKNKEAEALGLKTRYEVRTIEAA